MFLEILDFLAGINAGFNVLNYLTLRSAFALLTSLIITLIFGGIFIRKLQKLQLGQIIRSDGPATHLQKAGTPTMGGLLIIGSFIISVLTWGDFSNGYLWIILITAILFAGIGFIDDYLKIVKKNSKGLQAKQKIILQTLSSIFIIYLLLKLGLNTNLLIPFMKNFALEISISAFVIFTLFVLIGSSNAVNLTDGLDGLAIMPVVIIASGLAIFAYIGSNYNFSNYLNMEYMPLTSEIIIICAALIGSGLGFLWFNAYPAQVFMGDVGSLSLGAILAVIAIILRQELIFFIMSFVFVVEAISVILQTGYYKYTGGKRIFLMAPIHHHFEKKGMSEPKIIIRTWIITIIAVLIALATIKIR